MPPKNVAAPNAVKLFHCKICDKGYPRQTEYENHLRSYDHNHRQRLADMKRITAANDSDSNRTSKRGIDEMRSIPMDGKLGLGKGFKRVGVDTTASGSTGFKKVGMAVGGAGLGAGFKKVGVTTSIPAAPSGFKKVGVTTLGSGSSAVTVTKTPSEPNQPTPAPAEPFPSTKGHTKMDKTLTDDEMNPPTKDLTTDGEADREPQKQIRDEDQEAKVEEDVVMGEDDEDDNISWDEYDFRKPTGCDHAHCPGCKIVEDGWVVVDTI